jgi:hypothetical protein
MSQASISRWTGDGASCELDSLIGLELLRLGLEWTNLMVEG